MGARLHPDPRSGVDPTEEQLREALEAGLPAAGDAAANLSLTRIAAGYRCRIVPNAQPQTFDGPTASEAYGRALFPAASVEYGAFGQAMLSGWSFVVGRPPESRTFR